MKNILVTGNKGYIGSVLSDLLLKKGYRVVGYDIGYYDDCALYDMPKLHAQITKDIRDASRADVGGIDAVIHLAALSNDPLGELNPHLTEEINLGGTMRIARLAKEAGVKRFIYVSSQSMYGIAPTDKELEEDTSEKNPLTAYARTKWDAERALQELASDDFTVVRFRPSTVFGASPLLRCDIVFNDLVAQAYTTGRIELKSDGTPWRPVVHIQDVSNAFIAGLAAPQALIAGQAFNVGMPGGNYTVRDLAEAAKRAVPGSEIIWRQGPTPDERTYRVSFHKILTTLKDYYQPQWTLDKGARELITMFKDNDFTEKDYRGGRCRRLVHIRSLQEAGRLDDDLRVLAKA